MEKNDSVLDGLRKDIDEVRNFRRNMQRRNTGESPEEDIIEYTRTKLEQNRILGQWIDETKKRMEGEKAELNEARTNLEKDRQEFTRRRFDWEHEKSKKEKELDDVRIELAKRQSLLEQERNSLKRDFETRIAEKERQVEAERNKEIEELKKALTRKKRLLDDEYNKKIRELEVKSMDMEREKSRLETQKAVNEDNDRRLKKLEDELKQFYTEKEGEIKNKQEELLKTRIEMERKKEESDTDYLRKINRLNIQAVEYEKKMAELNIKTMEYENKLKEKDISVNVTDAKIKNLEKFLKEKDEKILKMEALLEAEGERTEKMEETIRNKEEEIKLKNDRIKHMEELLKNVPAPGEILGINEVDELVRGIAHQMRNPLGIIQSNAEFCLRKFRLKHEIADNIKSILSSVKFAAKKLEAFVDFVRPVHLKLARTPFSKCLDRVCMLMEEHCRLRGVELVREYSPDLPETRFDEERIQEVLLDVMFNAMESMPGGGGMRIQSEYDRNKNGFSVRIIDSGCGISRQNLKHVLDPFFSTKQDSLGLGLCSAKRIIGLHKGKIMIDSKEGKGTAVTLNFPVIT